MAFRIEFQLAGGEEEIANEFKAMRDLAIVPRKGDMVKIGRIDDFRRVDEVFLAPPGAGGAQIVVILEDDETLTTEQIVSAGWQVAG